MWAVASWPSAPLRGGAAPIWTQRQGDFRAMSKSRFLRPALGVAVALLLTSTASAAFAQDQSFGEPGGKRLDRMDKQLREVRAIVLQAHSTGAPVEIKESGPDPQVLGLTSRLDDMDQTLRAMTGQYESLQHELAVARGDAANAKTEAASLADRLDKLERQVTALAPVPPPPADAQTGAEGGLAGQAGQGSSQAKGPADSKAAYASARQLLLDGDYKAASAAFQDYVDRFGDTAQARPARYWLGETKFIQEDYTGAAAAYAGAIRGWPDTPWAPDALVKLSLSLGQMNRTKDACGAIVEFPRRYPHASPAAQARAAVAREKAGCAH
jgi:tol-pal system protein YbgF